MSDQILDEECGCGSELIRVSEDDPANEHGCPVVVCPGCFEIKRFER